MAIQRPILDMRSAVSGDDPYIGAEDVLSLLSAGDDPFIGALTPNLNMRQLNAAQILSAGAKLKALQDAQAAQRVENVAHMPSMPKVPLPIDSGAVLIAAGATQVIVVTPVSKVRIGRVVVDPTAAGLFIINGINIGRLNLLAGAGSVPASMFLPNSVDSSIEAPTIEAGTQIQFSVTNTSGAPARFIGAFQCIDLSVRV